MTAFAGAFMAAVGAIVTWQADVSAASLRHASSPQAIAARPFARIPGFEPLPSPSPSPSRVAGPSPAARPPVTVVAAARPPAPVRPPGIVIGSYQQVLINQDRAAAGLPPLTWSSCLAGVAQQQAARMAAQGYMSHANGISEDLNCNVGTYAGENVGYWTGGIDDTQLNAMFMASTEHRANILGPFHYVGTAWAVAPNGTAYIAVEFD